MCDHQARSNPQGVQKCDIANSDKKRSVRTERDQLWINEALGSGPEEPFSWAKLDKIRKMILGGQPSSA